MSYDSGRIQNPAGGGAWTLAQLNAIPASALATIPVGTKAYCSDIQSDRVWNGATWLSATRNIIAKIRASMAQASNGNNAVELQPWLPPATINTGPGNQIRANSTAYPQYTVFTNAAGTHQFVVRVAGTTTSAEPATVTTPTGYLGATNGSGNSDIYVGPTDQTHPPQIGTLYLAQKDANAFRNLIYSQSLS